MSTNRLRVMLVGLLAVFAISAVAATAAQAEGPVWAECRAKALGNWELTSGGYCIAATGGLGTGTHEVYKLEVGETRTMTSENISSVFKLSTALLTINCKVEKTTGVAAENEIIGGNPGTDKSEVVFEGCSPESKTVAECSAATNQAKPGVIGPFKVNTLLGYPKGSAGGTGEAYDQVFPSPSETEFTSFTLANVAGCGALKGKEVKVLSKATATKVTEPKFEAKCGVIAVVGKVVAGVFKKTASKETAKESALNFSGTPITEEEIWNPKTAKYEVVKCELEADVVGVGTAKAAEVGEAKVQLVSGEPIGWEV